MGYWHMAYKYSDYLGNWPGVSVMSRLFRCLAVCICALAAAGAVQTVHAADTVSGGDAAVSSPAPAAASSEAASQEILSVLQDVLAAVEDVQPYAAYDTYYGSISSTYLEYMRGYLSKLPSSAHYVASRVGQYDYVFAFGEDLSYNGSIFSGAAQVIRWNTYNNGTFTYAFDNSFYLNPGSYLVYTDLSERYPSLATSSDFTLRQILILFTVFCLCLTIDHMYQVRKIRRISRKEDL